MDYSKNKNRGSYTGGNSRDDREDPMSAFNKYGFKPSWITSGADIDLPVFADKAGNYMANNDLTSSKIRSIYGEIKRIQMGDFSKEKAAFYLLRPKVAYALGREDKSKRNGLKLFQIIFEKAAEHVSDNITFKHFCELMEAILAYHRSYSNNK